MGGGVKGRNVPMGDRTFVREELVETQEAVIASLRTQLAAMTAILQQGVHVPLEGDVRRAALDDGGGKLHVRYTDRWEWSVDGGGGEFETTHLPPDEARGWRPRRPQQQRHIVAGAGERRG